MSDARERRREQFQKAKTAKPKFSLAAWKYPLIVVALWGLAVGGIVATADDGPSCPGHWHSIVQVYNGEERVAFAHPGFQDSQNPNAPGTHIHDDSGVMHFHPGTLRCTELGDFMKHLAVEFSDSAMTLGPQHFGDAGEYPINDTHRVRAFHQPWGADGWTEVDLDEILSRQSANGERILFVYGNQDDATIALLQANAPPIPENYTPPPPDRTAMRMRIIGVSGIGILVLWLASKFRPPAES